MPPRPSPFGPDELPASVYLVADEASPALARWKQDHPDWFIAGSWNAPRRPEQPEALAARSVETPPPGGEQAGSAGTTSPASAVLADFRLQSAAPPGSARRDHGRTSAFTESRTTTGRHDGPSSPATPIQFERESPERRVPGGRFLTPDEEIRESRFSAALDTIRRLEPNNPHLTLLRDPDRTIPEQAVRQLEHEAALARERNVVIDGRVLPVEPPEKRANKEAERDAASSAPSNTYDALRPDDVIGDLLKAQPGELAGSRQAFTQSLDASRADGVRGKLQGSTDELTRAEKDFVEEELSQGKNVTIIPR